MACLQFEAMGVPRVKTELSVSYVDHNTLQMGYRNADDHRYLRSMAAQYGIVFSPPGTGICHQLHLENFAKPGKTLIGSDSHTPTAGGLGCLGIGAGGLSVALAMAGEPYFLSMPKVVNVYLSGQLKAWTAAKDIILFLLGKLSVKGGGGKIFEFSGPGVKELTVPQRATITNMGAELGATASIFPSDEQSLSFLSSMGRQADWLRLEADAKADYEERIEIDLCALEPLVAQPHMPDRVVPVRDLAGLQVEQVAIGSCTNSSYEDLKTTALILAQAKHKIQTELLISPGSKQVLQMLAAENLLASFFQTGARLLECSCGPCIGMGGSPCSAGVSVRTFNRNFEGRSGTKDGQIYLTSAQTAVNIALAGKFTDPKDWGKAAKKITLPKSMPCIRELFVFPPEKSEGTSVIMGPNIVKLEEFSPLPKQVQATVFIKVGDNISTDHILPAGPEITALRSNIPAISQHIFSRIEEGFAQRIQSQGLGLILGGENYGQGSSREHAALGPRYLGIQFVLVKSLARIHRANLINFGILPLLLADAKEYEYIEQGQVVVFDTTNIRPKESFQICCQGKQISINNDLTEKELDIIKAGGLLNYVSRQQ